MTATITLIETARFRLVSEKARGSHIQMTSLYKIETDCFGTEYWSYVSETYDFMKFHNELLYNFNITAKDKKNDPCPF